MHWLTQNITLMLGTIGALLPIVNPLSTVALVMTITQDMSEQERTEQVRRACIYMFCILTAFLVAGGVIMNFFGISLPGLRVAGGMIVSYLGFRMLFPDVVALSQQEHLEVTAKTDVSFTPLAMPSLSGPGSIAVIVGISASAQQDEHVVVSHVMIILGIAVVAMISYVVLRAADRLSKVLGITGMNAMAKIMGFLLICIGVQFIINGVLDVVRMVQAGEI
ncbi:MAG: MarC family NAAT transporter [Gallionellaceae bacterium]|jgi:multiple antibiotic resistance protein|nr:MarC family NAAT transporter [Gallionellaceae bacterium]